MSIHTKGRRSRRKGLPGITTPKQLPGLWTWHKFNTGIGINAGKVGQWSDQSGNGRHLKQAVGVNRPLHDGDGSISFDGTTDFLLIDQEVISNPLTVYLAIKINSSNTTTTGIVGTDVHIEPQDVMISLSGTLPRSHLQGWLSSMFTSRIDDEYVILTAVVDGANSMYAINENRVYDTISSPSSYNGVGLGCYNPYTGDRLHTEMKVKEFAVYDRAHSAVQQRAMTNYLKKLI